MNCREYAKSHGFDVVGKLKRMPNRYYGIQCSSYPWYLDDAGNEYLMEKSFDGWACSCVVTADGRII